ncbi:hypothetical protein TMatcc_004674 [Talaromyces marneffei ATCC 18224]
MIDLIIPAIAVGLPTSSFRFGVLNPIFCAAAAALPAFSMLTPLFEALSPAAAMSSGPSDSLLDKLLQEPRQMSKCILELFIAVRQQAFQVAELLRLVADGECAIVFGGEVETFHDYGEVFLFFFLLFVCYWDAVAGCWFCRYSFRYETVWAKYLLHPKTPRSPLLSSCSCDMI